MDNQKTGDNKIPGRLKIVLSLVILFLTISSCVTLKPYERVYLNDPHMQMSHHSGSNFSNYIHSIREGSTQSGSTKSSGGCGCN